MVEAVCKHVPYLDQLRHHVVWIGILFELVEVHSFLPSACILWLRLFLSLNMLGCTGDGGNMVMRKSSAIDSRQRVHICSADMHRSISIQFYPDD